jgi:hypothetical protein
MPLRTLSLGPLTDISEIWNEAEMRLKTNRSNFSLVTEGSNYLPTSGFLPKPTQLFEIRWQGRGGIEPRKRRPEPKDTCHTSEQAAGLLKKVARLKRTLDAKCCAIKNWFRLEKKTKSQENYEEVETKKVSVIVYLEDPGGHTPELRPLPDGVRHANKTSEVYILEEGGQDLRT